MNSELALIKTGIEEIDRQHGELLELLDELNEHIGGKFEFSASMTVITRLMDYVRYHFAYEEKLLEERHYPDLEAHKEEHNRLTLEVAALWREVENGHEITEKLPTMIRQWIQEHINAEDAEYARYQWR